MSKPQPLPMFSTLGHGYDVTQAEPRNPVLKMAADPRTDVAKTYRFRGTEYAVPVGLTVDPRPGSSKQEDGRTDICKDVHDYQRSLAQSMGLEVPGFGEFARSASVKTNERVFTAGANYLLRNSSLYSFFKMRVDRTRPDLAAETFLIDVRKCTTDDDWVTLFERYGTHVVREGDVGGYLALEFILNASSMEQSTLTDAGLQTEAKIELDGISASSDTAFSVRSERTSSSFRANSSRRHDLLGGNPAADTLRTWLKSLEDAELPDLRDDFAPLEATPDAGVVTVATGSTEGHAPSASVLALVNLKLEPLSRFVPSGELREETARRANDYIEANRIEAPPRKHVKPLMPPAAGSVHEVAPQGAYHEGAWAFQKTNVAFGLDAVPGTKGIVTVDHPLVTEKQETIWPGQVERRDQFYGAGRIWVRFACEDPTAKLLVRVW